MLYCPPDFAYFLAEEASLSSIDIPPVPDDADNNLPRVFIYEVKDSIIADAHAPAVTILKLLTTAREGIGF